MNARLCIARLLRMQLLAIRSTPPTLHGQRRKTELNVLTILNQSLQVIRRAHNIIREWLMSNDTTSLLDVPPLDSHWIAASCNECCPGYE